jgi:hypothetical protein
MPLKRAKASSTTGSKPSITTAIRNPTSRHMGIAYAEEHPCDVQFVPFLPETIAESGNHSGGQCSRLPIQLRI